MINKQDFIETNCLFCREPNDRVVYNSRLFFDTFTGYSFSARRKRKREHYRIVRCDNCSLVRSNPIVSEEVLNKLYRESDFVFSDEMPFAAKTYSLLLRRVISRYTEGIDSLLEIGCSTGFFLEEVLRLGINDVIGFEPSRGCYQQAKDKTKRYIVNDVFKKELLVGKKFDIVCNFHVIDHLRDPLFTLKQISEVTTSSGYILIVCHDVDSWSAKLLGNYSPIFDIEHVYLFSKKTLAALLENAGFIVLESGALVNTYSFAYWLRMMPSLDRLMRILPNFIRRIPITLNAGNLYFFAKKKKG